MKDPESSSPGLHATASDADISETYTASRPAQATGFRLPSGPSLRIHFASSGAFLVAIALTLFGVYLPAVVIPYAFTDDYAILFVAEHLGSSLWFGDSVIDTVSGSGRPLAGLLDQLFFSLAGTIDNLRFVRLVGIVGIVALAVLLHWALVRSRVRRLPAALIAILVCSLPAFNVYASWTVLFNAPYAALLGGGASMLAVASVDAPEGLVLDRLAGATALLLGAGLIYQPAAMFFWVFLAVALVATVPDSRRALRLTWTHGAIAAVAFALAYLIRKVAVHLADNAPNAGSDVFTHDPVRKIDWFIHEPLYWSLNLFDLSPSRWLAGLVAITATTGILLGLRRHRADALPYVAIGLALVPLCLLPNLVVRGEQTTYRMLGGLSALIALYFCLGALCIWLSFLHWLQGRADRRTLLWTQRLGLAISVAFVATGTITAARTVTARIVLPQHTELGMIRSKVADLPPGVTRVGYVLIGWNQGFTDRYISDEFIPSSAQPYVAEPAVVLTLRDLGRLNDDRPPIVDALPLDPTAFQIKEPVVDMRDLQDLPVMPESTGHTIAPAAALPFPLTPRTGPARLCVVIPVYNEARVLELTFARVAAVLEQLDVSWSILFVSDGSVDDTVTILESLAAREPRVKYLCLSRNFGHQAALAAGLDHAEGDVVVTMDGDLQHPPELLAVLVEAWRLGYDVVHTRKLSTHGLSLWRRLATRLAYSAIGRVASVEIIPEASDFRLLDRTALRAVTAMPERHPLYRGLTLWIGFRQAVVPYEATARAEGASRYGLRQLIQLFARSFFDFSNAPLHVGVFMGAVTILVCFAYVVYTLVAYLIGRHVPQGYLTLVFVIVLLSSINLTFSGILGVYLARIYDEVRRRPEYVVGRAQSDSPSAVVEGDEPREDLERLRSL